MPYTVIFADGGHMQTLKPTIQTTIHEWLADRVKWVQYPANPVYKPVDVKLRRTILIAALAYILLPPLVGFIVGSLEGAWAAKSIATQPR